MRTAPFNYRNVLCVLWWVEWIHVEGLIISVEVNITPKLACFLNLTSDAVNLFENSVVTGSSVHFVAFFKLLLMFLAVDVVILLVVLELLLTVLAVLVVIIVLLLVVLHVFLLVHHLVLAVILAFNSLLVV